MADPTPLELLAQQQERFEDRTEKRLNAHSGRLDEHDDDLAVVPVMKRAFYWVAVVLTGAIVAVVGSAVAIILSNGGGPK